MPGRRSTIRYWPAPSVTAVRTFSMSAGLAASTVTPGMTAPDASLTTPAIDAWAYAMLGINTAAALTRRNLHNTRMLKHLSGTELGKRAYIQGSPCCAGGL